MEVSEASGISLLEGKQHKCVQSHDTGKYSGKTKKIPAGTRCFVVLHSIDYLILSNIPKKAHWKTLVSHFVCPWPMKSCVEFATCRNWDVPDSSYFFFLIIFCF